MNKIIFASLAAAAIALMSSPTAAEARHDHDEVVAAIGGFVGGVIVGSAIDGNNPSAHVEVSYGHDHGRHRHGHWEMRRVRVWVPGHWTYVDRDCHRPRKVWVPGRYEYRRDRVWVAHRHSRHCDRSCG